VKKTCIIFGIRFTMTEAASQRRKLQTWTNAFEKGVRNVVLCTLFIILVQVFRGYLGEIRLRRVKNKYIKIHGADAKFCLDYDSKAVAEYKNFTEIRNSNIEGQGLFARKGIPCGTLISTVYRRETGLGFGVYMWQVTKLSGQKINHHDIPNVRTVKSDHKWDIFALRDIASGEEIVADYVDQPYFILPPMFFWDLSDANGLGYEWYPRNMISLVEFIGLPLIILLNTA
jgi:hypothetical protein